MSKCFYHSEYCAGEVFVYEFAIGKEEKEKRLNIMGCFPLCETHKRGELYVHKPMRPSLPYQGIPRRKAILNEIEIIRKK